MDSRDETNWYLYEVEEGKEENQVEVNDQEKETQIGNEGTKGKVLSPEIQIILRKKC